MHTVNAYARTSNRYIDEYKHLDGERFVAAVRLTPRKMVKEGNGYDSGRTYVQYLRIPLGVDTKDLQRALRDTMGYSGCTHEYDCCGCASSYVGTVLVSPRKLRVTTFVSYNY